MSNYPGKIITNNADAGYSVSFNGASTLTATGSSVAVGTSDFTIEFWVYYTGSIAGDLVDQFVNYGVQVWTSSSKINLGAYGISNLLAGNTTLVANQWYHVAISKDSTLGRIYINGVLDNSTSSSGWNFSGAANFSIGSANGSQYLTGYLSNVRVTLGTALYVSDFVPPTQLIPTGATKLLTCASPTLIDLSSNAYALTLNGSPIPSTFTPFAAYNPYTPELGSASPGIWSLNELMEQTLTRRSNNYDPYFTYNSLLIHGAGTDGAQNNTFLDSSTANSGSPWSLTRNGNVYQGAFTPFTRTGWSVYLDGNVNINNPAGLPTAFAGWGGRTRTFEMWLYREDSSACNLQTAYAAVVANGRWTITIDASSRLDFGWTTSTSSQENIQTVNTVPVGSWCHIAVVVDSTTSTNTTIRLFINGAMETFTGKNLSTQTSTYGWQSLFGYASYTYGAPAGYFSNLRWSNNLRYTSSFAPPTANFTNDANTLYLIAQDYRLRDRSSNAYTVTVAAGTPRIMPFGPFNANTLTAYRDTTVGGSGFFPGSGSSYVVTTDSSTAFLPQTTTTPFTIECWVYNTGTSSTVLYAAIAVDNYAYTLGFGSAVGTYDSTQTPWFGVYGFGWSGLRSTTPIPLNAWTHIACVFTGSTCYIYQDGVMTASGGPSTWEVKTAGKVRIGCRPDAGTDTFTGYIAGARVVIGSNLYPSGTTFTPPTAPPTNITNTKLLLNFTNAAVIDSTGLNIIDTVGQGQISTSQSRFGRGSLFSGSSSGGFIVRGEGLSIAFGNGDFTIEFYAYLTSLGTWVFDTCPAGVVAPTNRILLQVQSSGSVDYLTYQGVTTLISSGGGVFSTNRWHHIALCKASSQTRLFVDGIQRGSTYSDTLDYPAQLNRPILCADGYAEGFSGNIRIDELRITRGYARYKTNFKPQTSRWQDQ
jgi:hypothetical protein